MVGIKRCPKQKNTPGLHTRSPWLMTQSGFWIMIKYLTREQGGHFIMWHVDLTGFFQGVAIPRGFEPPT